MLMEPRGPDEELDEMTRTVGELWVMVREQQHRIDAHEAELRNLKAGQGASELDHGGRS